MPTPEWFAENPKISAYISKDLDDALKAWMAENRIKKVSQALTTILEQHLGLADAPQQATPGNYATLEQLRELVARVEVLEMKREGKPKAKSSTKATEPQQMSIGGVEATDSEWMTTREAYSRYGTSTSYDGFRKSSDKRLMEDFQIEADHSRKTGNGKTDKWLRKV